MSTVYKNVKDIKARVKTDWTHKNHKFPPGSYARVNPGVLPREHMDLTGKIWPGRSYVSDVKQRRVGRIGKVLAVSCTPDGLTRGKAQNGFCERMFTRYYVQFRDNVILGYDSHHLDKTLEHSV